MRNLSLWWCFLVVAVAQDPRIVADSRVRSADPVQPVSPEAEAAVAPDHTSSSSSTYHAGASPAADPQPEASPYYPKIVDVPYPTPTPISFPVTAPTTAQSGPIRTIKKIFNSVVLGKTTSEDDLIERDARDVRDGVVRVRDGEEGVLGSGNWLVLVHGGSTATTGGLDTHYLDAHANASALATAHQRDTFSASSNEQYEEGKETEFGFARVDYMREWKLCSRWLIFRAPVLIIVTNDQTSSHNSQQHSDAPSPIPSPQLRFLAHHHVFKGGQALHDLLASGRWRDAPVYQSRWMLGGDAAFLVEYYITLSSFISTHTASVPHIVWIMLGGLATRGLMQMMHTPTGAGAVPGPGRAGTVRAGQMTGQVHAHSD